MSHSAFPHVDPVVTDVDLVGDVVADFVAAAREWPDRPAILFNGAAISYQAFEERVRLAAARYGALRSSADGQSGLVAALVSHTPDAAEHLLGILASSATYCPIDTALPAARKQALANALGVDRLFAAAPSPDESTDLTFETLAEETPNVADTELAPSLWCRSDPAYVLCTSGSTGLPKPVVVSRHALTVTVRALRRLFALTPDDRVLQFASLGWDTCLEEILPTLTAGATLVFDGAAHSGSFPPFLRMLAERQVTVLDLPTAFWHELVNFLREENAVLPGSVRLVVIGGERVDPTRLRQWRELNVGHVRLLNTYGCTETTMVTHAVQLSGPGTEPGVAAQNAEAALGRPLPHVSDYVTEEGELLVSGPSLATEYLGMPEHTAIAFPVADHGSGPSRWFHTGDLVIRGEHGLLYARGRVDEQVKVLGVRVHPAEVEAQLNAHPAVAGSVVVGERLLGRTTLTAYVVPAAATTPAELKEHIRRRLPAQFTPSQVKFVESLVYTASGKLDRAATQRAATAIQQQGACQ